LGIGNTYLNNFLTKTFHPYQNDKKIDDIDRMGLILKHVYNSSKINEIISNGFSSYKAA
jgi:hypothetical protein